MEILRREFIYIWYYFSIQLEQVFFYWVLGMVIGSAISVFGKGKIQSALGALGGKRLGAKRFVLYLVYVILISLVIGLTVDRIL